MTNKEEITQIKLEQNYKVYLKKVGVRGLIQWWVEVRADKLGKDLIINTLEEYDKIILNKKEIKQRDKKGPRTRSPYPSRKKGGRKKGGCK